MYYKQKQNKDLLFGKLIKEDEGDELSKSLNISEIERSLEDDLFTTEDKAYPRRKNKEFVSAEKVANCLN